MWAVRKTETPAWGQGIPGSLSWPQPHLDLYKLLSCCDGSDVWQMTQTWGSGLGGKASWISWFAAGG